MSNKPKAMIIESSLAYENLFESMGFELAEVSLQNVPSVNLLVFTGGEDVSPNLYGEAAHSYTGCNPRRDAYETRFFESAVENKIPMVGICRGGQFLNVMCGGKMHQHVDNHIGDHFIDVKYPEEDSGLLLVSSTHHQMMHPGLAAEVLATRCSHVVTTVEGYSERRFYKRKNYTDYEVLFYPNQKALCFQPHPEFIAPQYEGMRKYFNRLVQTLLMKENVK